MTLQLRAPNDAARLFSALGDDLATEGSTSLTQFEENALAADSSTISEGAVAALILSALIASVVGWAAIRGYERNGESLGKGLMWAISGFMFPLPVALLTAVKES